MRKKHGSDTAVQGTNDSSVVSKLSATTQGYFHDSFLKSFVSKASRRAPLINRGYYVRWKAVDHSVKQFLHITEQCPKRQVLSLGAGFDSLYFRLHAEGALSAAVVFEVDFPEVVQRKAALISNTDLLKESLGDWSLSQPADTVLVSSSQYRLLGVDMRSETEMEAALSRAGVEWSCPTLLLSEVVLTYMDTERSDAMISWAARLFPQSLFVMYEQICPHDPFGRVMQDHFLKLNSALHALIRYPDPAAQTLRFLDRGWEHCVCMDMNHFYLDLVPEKERNRVESLEPFDEFEEWHQKCSHYFILTASKGCLPSRSLIAAPLGSQLPCVTPVWRPETLKVQLLQGGLEGPGVKGVGMASAVLGPGVLLLFGGASKAGRVEETKLLIREQTGWTSVCVQAQKNWGTRMHHTATTVPGWGVLVFGGRSSPLKPVSSVLRLTYGPCSPADVLGISAPGWLTLKALSCTGTVPLARWRHTATLLRYKGQEFLFVFGGRTETESVLGDAHFLRLEDQHWTAVPVEGAMPAARHSHSACAHEEGVVICGGLGRGGVPLGDTVLLQCTASGFHWKELLVQPPLVPRYSHCSHAIGQRLVLVGGVWLQADGVPGVAVIHLTTGCSVEYRLDISEVPWPLMLQSVCSEPVDEDGTTIMLIGGGGNCFSFGTHLNSQPVTLDIKGVL
ncbi:tRNA wybutosine-synthesizing protein 4 isoform X1 [Brienomyrus brachyistius]|uniref:tRNA wybutosine-synthesizing protein 4 isoform X1 n=2 Tax=Brienomyrus brachyistius TaxID=42636 RepID=UPI0020B2D339|nr:tRNA wybutosine-synthesizing protein 4 isoform X1 [Brienomyrus brachyistius]